MTQHIPYHDMYSGPGESMGEVVYHGLKNITRNFQDLYSKSVLELAGLDEEEEKPLDPQTVYFDSQERFQKIIDSAPKEANFNGIKIKEDHSVEEPLVWDREKTYKWVEII